MAPTNSGIRATFQFVPYLSVKSFVGPGSSSLLRTSKHHRRVVDYRVPPATHHDLRTGLMMTDLLFQFSNSEHVVIVSNSLVLNASRFSRTVLCWITM